MTDNDIKELAKILKGLFEFIKDLIEFKLANWTKDQIDAYIGHELYRLKRFL